MKSQAWWSSKRPPKCDTELSEAGEEVEGHFSQKEQHAHGTEA